MNRTLLTLFLLLCVGLYAQNTSDIECPYITKADYNFVCGESSFNSTNASLQIILTTHNIPNGVYADKFYYTTTFSGSVETISQVTVLNNMAVIDLNKSGYSDFNAVFGFKDSLLDCPVPTDEARRITIPAWNLNFPTHITTNDIQFCTTNYGQSVQITLEDLADQIFGSENFNNHEIQWYKSTNFSGENQISATSDEIIDQNNYYFYDFTNLLTSCKSNLSVPIGIRVLTPQIYTPQSISFESIFCSIDHKTIYDLEPYFYNPLINQTPFPFGTTKWFYSETGSEEVPSDTVIQDGDTYWLGAYVTYYTKNDFGQTIENFCYSIREPYTFNTINPAPEPIVEITETEFSGYYELRITNLNENTVYELDNYFGYVSNGVYRDITEGSYKLITKTKLSEFPYYYTHLNACTTYTDIVVSSNSLRTFNFLKTNELIVYPNPAKEVLEIQTSSNTPIEFIEIYTSLGQLILTSTSKKINIAHLSQGLHIVRIITTNGTIIKKFIKE